MGWHQTWKFKFLYYLYAATEDRWGAFQDEPTLPGRGFPLLPTQPSVLRHYVSFFFFYLEIIFLKINDQIFWFLGNYFLDVTIAKLCRVLTMCPAQCHLTLASSYLPFSSDHPTGLSDWITVKCVGARIQVQTSLVQILSSGWYLLYLFMALDILVLIAFQGTLSSLTQRSVDRRGSMGRSH